MYELRQPQQIAMVVLLNQLARVDRTFLDLKGAALYSLCFYVLKLFVFISPLSCLEICGIMTEGNNMQIYAELLNNKLKADTFLYK